MFAKGAVIIFLGEEEIKKYLIAFIVTMLTGCTSLSPPPVSILSRFDADQARGMLKEGTNTIKGSCRIQQRGSGVVTCAGRQVNLLPATDYAIEKMRFLYGSKERGFLPKDVNPPVFAQDPPEYKKLSVTTTCDAKGYFKFEKVADGSFFVVMEVSWQVDGFPQGGSLMQRVEVSGGQTREIVLGL